MAPNDIPPRDEFERISIIKKKIMSFSNGLLENFTLGIIVIISINCLFLYCIIKRINLFSMFTYIFLLYLFGIILISKVFKLNKSK